jgi:hypothetical protein
MHLKDAFQPFELMSFLRNRFDSMPVSFLLLAFTSRFTSLTPYLESDLEILEKKI